MNQSYKLSPASGNAEKFKASCAWLKDSQNRIDFQGEWVALDGDKLVAHSKSRVDLHKELNELLGDSRDNILVAKIMEA